MRFIPTWVHGIIDYVGGVALLLAPTIFGFSYVGGPAVFVPRLLGALLIIYSFFTQYELGVVKVLPMKAHLAIDYVAAIFLALSPWILGFSGAPANAWVPHVTVGILVFLVTLATQTHAHMHMTTRTA